MPRPNKKQQLDASGTMDLAGALGWCRDALVDGFLRDQAMLLMSAGAVCKFMELVVLRNDFSVVRFGFSILGGLLIAAGAGLVAFHTTGAIIMTHNNKLSEPEKEDASAAGSKKAKTKGSGGGGGTTKSNTKKK